MSSGTRKSRVEAKVGSRFGEEAEVIGGGPVKGERPLRPQSNI